MRLPWLTHPLCYYRYVTYCASCEMNQGPIIRIAFKAEILRHRCNYNGVANGNSLS